MAQHPQSQARPRARRGRYARAMPDTVDCIVIGAGMSGLAAADALRREGLTVSDHRGGRHGRGSRPLRRRRRRADRAVLPPRLPPGQPRRARLSATSGSRTSSSGGTPRWRSCIEGRCTRSTGPPTSSRSRRCRCRPASGSGPPPPPSSCAATPGAWTRRPWRKDGPRWFGRSGYDTVWRPLLEAKFGPHAADVAMAWLVARIRQRAGARRSTGDRLGYIRGGTGALAAAFARQIESAGCPADPVGAGLVASLARRPMGRCLRDPGRRGRGRRAPRHRVRERARARAHGRAAGARTATPSAPSRSGASCACSSSSRRASARTTG